VISPDMLARRHALSDYQEGVERLAGALEEVWRACAKVDGLNLPEALSYALGLSAKRLAGAVLASDADRGLEPGEAGVLCEAAGDLLVRHRPGSWEAEHVWRLVFPPDLVPDPT
jgi:hypothetical protein